MSSSDLALVLIDLQKEFFLAPEFGAIKQMAEEKGLLDNVRTALSAARAQGVPIFFSQVVRRPDYSDYVRPYEVAPFKEGSEGVELIDGLATESDVVVPKRRRNAFYGTPLEIFLRAHGVRRIAIGGIATDVGVESTVRDAWDRDLDIIVLSDCCATADATVDRHALTTVLPKWARVMTTQEDWLAG